MALRSNILKQLTQEIKDNVERAFTKQIRSSRKMILHLRLRVRILAHFHFFHLEREKYKEI